MGRRNLTLVAGACVGAAVFAPAAGAGPVATAARTTVAQFTVRGQAQGSAKVPQFRTSDDGLVKAYDCQIAPGDPEEINLFFTTARLRLSGHERAGLTGTISVQVTRDGDRESATGAASVGLILEYHGGYSWVSQAASSGTVRTSHTARSGSFQVRDLMPVRDVNQDHFITKATRPIDLSGSWRDCHPGSAQQH